MNFKQFYRKAFQKSEKGFQISLQVESVIRSGRSAAAAWFAAMVLCLGMIGGCAPFSDDIGHWPDVSLVNEDAPPPEPALLIQDGKAPVDDTAGQEDIGETKAAPLPEPGQEVDPEQSAVPEYVPEDEIPKYAKSKITPASSLPVRLNVDRTGKIVTLDFQEEYLCNVLKVLSSVMGVNVVAHKDIAEDEVTIYLKNISPGKALEALCKQYGYWYEDNNEFIRLVAVSDFGKVIARPGGNIRMLKFSGMVLPQVLMMLSERTGRNVVCHQNANEISVNLLLTDVSFLGAVEVICKKYGLWYRYDKEKDYFVLMKAEDFGSDMVVDYSHKTRVFNLKYASAPQIAETVALAMGNRVRYTAPSTLRSYEHLKTEDYEDDEASIAASDTQEDMAVNISGTEFEGNLTPEKIKRLVKKRFGLMLTSEDLRRVNHEIGFALLAIFLRNNAIVACSTDNNLLNQIESLIARLDTPTPQVLIETKILSVSLNDDFSSFFDLGTFDDGISTTTTETITNGVVETITETITTPLADITNSKGQGAFDLGIIGGTGSALYRFVDDDWNIEASINLLKADGRVSSISSPMLVAAQNSEARAFVGIDDYPLTTNITAETVYDDDGQITSTILNPVVTTSDIGTELKVTPQINEDKTVTLRLYIKQSAISTTKPKIYYYSSETEDLASHSVEAVNNEEISTTITIPHGKTLALGGLVKEVDGVTESKVPLLGDLPLVGFFFKDHETEKSRSETVFLLTPHIIMSPDQAGNVSGQALKEMEHSYIKENKSKLHEYDKERKVLERE